MSVGYVYVVFGKMSVQLLCPFFNQIFLDFFFFDVGLYEFFVYFYTNPLSDIALKYIFSYSVGSFFILLTVFFAVGFFVW